MISEIGHFALVLALVFSVVQTIVPLYGAARGHQGLMALSRPLAVVIFLLVSVSFGAITRAFLVSDFSLALVVQNSHTDKPLIYKISGVWGNHEGSMLLWVLILALFGACAAVAGRHVPLTLRARALAVQGSITLAFLAFILFTSNPFLRLANPPMNGSDLNPLLQDPGLAFHPPFLYLGYVGLSMAFSFAVAALIEGRVDAAWARWVRPWTLAAWMFLTVGIGLGSWWAYYELGWGGFWFWDPVENSSFMPWLFAAALLHSAIVVEKRESLKAWTILLAILAFGFSLIGTFIVRSGVITSVHAFANDPERGIFILAILAVFIGGSLVLFSLRAAALEARGVFGMVSREAALVLNNILLAVAGFVVFIGTIWPLVAEMLWDRKLSVGAPFFEASFTPFFVVLAIALPIGALLPWKRADLPRAMRPLIGALVLALAVMVLIYAMQTGRSGLGPIGAGLGTWLVVGALIDLAQRTGRGALGARFKRLARVARADFGRVVAHGGLGITMIGISALMAYSVEDIRIASFGEGYVVDGYTITLHGVGEVQGPNYFAQRGEITVTRDGFSALLQPERRVYPAAGMPTTEAGIRSGFLGDLYVVIGEPQPGGWTVRTYIKPFANWIWGGTILMAIGAGLSLSDRRLRMGAAGRKPAGAA